MHWGGGVGGHVCVAGGAVGGEGCVCACVVWVGKVRACACVR